MPLRTSDILNVTHEQLDNLGCFDSFVDIDALLYVSPKLLSRSSAKELKGSRTAVLEYFKKLILFIKNIKYTQDLFWIKAFRCLQFKEISNLALGYSKLNVSGRGIGPGFARKILSDSIRIVRAGIEDPEIFELMGIFQDGIGADRISDMIVRIIYKPFLIRYSASIAAQLCVPTKNVNGSLLPFNKETGKVIILLPKDILANLPIAIDRSDISDVCNHNETLRNFVNKRIGMLWSKEILNMTKKQVLDTCLSDPKILSALISRYKERSSNSYDFAKDPKNVFKWFDQNVELASKYPLTKIFTSSSSFSIEVCNHYKELVENNGIFQLLYDENCNLQHERYAQLSFFALADAYCRHAGFVLSREPNAGRGPVDFTISNGYFDKTCLEFKFSNNPKLIQGYQIQLPIYEGAEKSVYGIYVVIKVEGPDNKLKELMSMHAKNASIQRELIIIDGTRRQSASHAKAI